MHARVRSPLSQFDQPIHDLEHPVVDQLVKLALSRVQFAVGTTRGGEGVTPPCRGQRSLPSQCSRSYSFRRGMDVAANN